MGATINSDPGPQFCKEGELSVVRKGFSQPLVVIDIEFAVTDEEHEQGLMYRKKMDPLQGMFFIFEREKEQSFWMHNTFIPLDILYIKADSTILGMAENTEPFSARPIPSNGNAKYVLEVNAGFCSDYQIGPGDRINWKKTE